MALKGGAELGKIAMIADSPNAYPMHAKGVATSPHPFNNFWDTAMKSTHRKLTTEELEKLATQILNEHWAMHGEKLPIIPGLHDTEEDYKKRVQKLTKSAKASDRGKTR